MTEQQRFIREQLIPFIRRDSGKGFSMDYWIANAETYFQPDQRPVCGTVCCIGGSIELLRKKLAYREEEGGLGRLIGLNEYEFEGLCYGWMGPGNENSRYVWPRNYRDNYREAKTPAQQANVACNLLEEIAEVGGAALEKL
jgi:hypothetical protein